MFYGPAAGTQVLYDVLRTACGHRLCCKPPCGWACSSCTKSSRSFEGCRDGRLDPQTRHVPSMRVTYAVLPVRTP